MMKDSTILAIGDKKDWESFRKFTRSGKNFQNFKTLSYTNILSKKLPKIKTNNIIIYFFFPFEYWDTCIEPKHYHGVYGSRKFYTRFVKLCKRIQKNTESRYKDKNLHYIIHPSMMHLDRDKEVTKEILKRYKVNIPKTIKSRNIAKIKQLSKRKNLFIKVRYGAMGKGITYLSKDSCRTNFRFKNNRIKSRKSDYGWSFIDIPDNNFLKQLLKQDITIEEEIPPYLIKNRKFDLRMYVSFGKVIYMYPRSNKDISVTTNISQGGKGETQNFLKKIPKSLLSKAKTNAINSAEALKAKFAGIDIMFDGKTKKPIVIEVNVFPGFPGSKRFNLSKRVLSDIKRWK